MARKTLVRTAIQIDPEALERIDKLADRRRESRSRTIRDAVDIGLPVIEQRQEAIEGLSLVAAERAS